MSTTQNVQIFQYNTAFYFEIPMSKIPKGVSLAPPYPTVIYMEFKSRLLRANQMAKKKEKKSLMGFERVTLRLIGKNI